MPYSILANKLAKEYFIDRESEQEYIDRFSYENICKSLIGVDRATFTCQCLVDNEIRTQQVNIFYIDKDMNIIGVSNCDITESVGDRQNLLSLLANVVEVACVVDAKTGEYTTHTVETVTKSLSPITGDDFDSHCEMLARRSGKYEECVPILEQLSINTMKNTLLTHPEGYTITHGGVVFSENSIKMDKIFWVDSEKRFIGILRTDITKVERTSQRQQKDLYEALELAKRANSAKSDFLATMSHDIRTPMNAITGMTELALMEPIENGNIKESLLTIKSASAQLLNLINDILEMSRIESGKIAIQNESFNNTHEHSIAMQRYIGYAKAEGINFIHSNTTNNTQFIGDVLKIHRIIDNLLSNSFKFTPKGGTVSYELTEQPTFNPNISFLRIVVSDSGIGMSKETLENLFEPFYIADRVHSNNSTGLGLPIVKRILEYCDGTIEVTSELGKGTTFTVMIPVRVDNAKPLDKAVDRNIDTVALLGKRVLLSEDHPVNQKVASRILEKAGIEVTIVSNGKECVEKFLSSPQNWFDAILMDIRMPIMTGLEASRAIRASKHPDGLSIPIIAMTDNAFMEDRKISMESGMNSHLSKPIKPNELFETLIKYIK